MLDFAGESLLTGQCVAACFTIGGSFCDRKEIGTLDRGSGGQDNRVIGLCDGR